MLQSWKTNRLFIASKPRGKLLPKSCDMTFWLCYGNTVSDFDFLVNSFHGEFLDVVTWLSVVVSPSFKTSSKFIVYIIGLMAFSYLTNKMKMRESRDITEKFYCTKENVLFLPYFVTLFTQKLRNEKKEISFQMFY